MVLRTSVPELVNRTISTEGTAAITIFARMFSWTDGAPKDVPFSKVACVSSFGGLDRQVRAGEVSGQSYRASPIHTQVYILMNQCC